ncbi:MAG: DUF29 domain-containing protein [Pseudomonadota bacterium]
MATAYETDIVAWANEQAALLRSGQWSAIDVLNIAEEIEDVGKSERRELASRLSVLMAHLLKWKFQAARQGASWRATIDVQRARIRSLLSRMPSLAPSLSDADWIQDAWQDALVIFIHETGIVTYPKECIWPIDQILNDEFLPE